MKRHTKILLISNLLTVLVLAVILVRDNYPQRIRNRLANFVHDRPNTKPYHFSDNISFEQQTGFYPFYSSEKNIVMLGNSITSRINWGELLNRGDIANMGIDGDITEGYLNRLGFIKKVNPKICFIEGGINDLFHGVSPDTIINNLYGIITEIKNFGIVPVIITVPFVTSSFPDSKNMNSRIRTLNAEIIKLAETEQTKLIDLNKLLPGTDFLNSEYAVSDGLHLTGKAYIEWCKEIAKILEHEKI